MIVINSHVFAIVPKDAPFMELMSADYVEVFTRDILDGYISEYGFSLHTAEFAYRGIAVWVCPD